MQYVVDFDDFCESNNGLATLAALKMLIPEFKATVFTIVGRCSYAWINSIKREYPWLDMVPHGLLHETSRECQHWTYKQTISYLNFVENFGLTHGFKAPGWQISDWTYAALLEKGYWVADQAYNDRRRPPALKAYVIKESNQIHGHIGHLGGHNANAIELIYNTLASLKGEFLFIRDTL